MLPQIGVDPKECNGSKQHHRIVDRPRELHRRDSTVWHHFNSIRVIRATFRVILRNVRANPRGMPCSDIAIDSEILLPLPVAES